MNQIYEDTEHTKLEEYTNWIVNLSINRAGKIFESNKSSVRRPVEFSHVKTEISYTNISKRKIKDLDIIWNSQTKLPYILLFTTCDNTTTLAILNESSTITLTKQIQNVDNSNVVYLELLGKEELLLMYLNGFICRHKITIEENTLEVNLLTQINNNFELDLVTRISKDKSYFLMYINTPNSEKCLILYDLSCYVVIKRIVFGASANSLVLNQSKSLLGITFDSNFVIMDIRSFCLLLNGKEKKLFYSPGIASLIFHKDCNYFSILKTDNKIEIFGLQKGSKVRLYKRILTKDFKCSQLLELGNDLSIVNKDYKNKQGYITKYLVKDNVDEVVVYSDDREKQLLGKVYRAIEFSQISRLVLLTEDKKIIQYNIEEG